MKRSAKRVATKWLTENADDLSSSKFPEEVLSSLCLYSDDDLYDLSSRIIWNRLIGKFIEFKEVEGDDREDYDQEEMEIFLEIYRKDNFPQYKKIDNFMDAMVTRMTTLLSALCMRYRGLITFEEFDIWYVIDKDVACFDGRTRRGERKNITIHKEQRIIEKDTRDVIFELFKSGEKEKAQDLLRRYKSILERLND